MGAPRKLGRRVGPVVEVEMGVFSSGLGKTRPARVCQAAGPTGSHLAHVPAHFLHLPTHSFHNLIQPVPDLNFIRSKITYSIYSGVP
jgi:hypothetical protein